MSRLTTEVLKSLNLGSEPNDRNVLTVESALDWISNNTVIQVDNLEALSANVKMFILKYIDLMNITSGVASESIEGLSQSFVTGQSLETQIYNLAVAFLGLMNLKSNVIVFSGEDGWDYEC